MDKNVVSIYDCQVHIRIPDETKRSGFRHSILANWLSMLARTWDEVIEITEFEYIGGGLTYNETHEWDVNDRLNKATLIYDGKRFTIRRLDVNRLQSPQRLDFSYNSHNFTWKGDKP